MSVKDNGSLKVAISSLSLGDVAKTRGLEVWAENLAHELKNRGIDVTLYKGWGKENSSIEKVLGSIKRDSGLAKNVNKFLPPFSWRFNLGSTYAIEGTTFAINLIKEIVKEKFDIVHTGDVPVARALVAAKKVGAIKAKVIFADAIPDETLNFIGKYGFVQQRTPCFFGEALKQGISEESYFAIPNFVDAQRFKPGIATNLRNELGIPRDAVVIMCAATIDKSYKRVDYLISEAADLYFRKNADIYLVLAGAERKESKELMQTGKDLLGDRFKALLNQPHSRMPEIYAAADVFVMCSINEVFGIAFIEAMSCGVPAIGHIYPPTQWVIGTGGECVDMLKKGSLSDTLEKYLNNGYRLKKGEQARKEALQRFSKDIVVEQIVAMYREVSRCSH